MSTASYFDRFLDPVIDALAPETARAIVNLRADAQTQAHIGELCRKANDGTLTVEEDAEYKEFIEAVDIVSILQSKARKFLARHTA